MSASLWRYAGVGLCATAVHYVLMVGCVEGLGWPAWLGSGLGAMVGAQAAFVGNRRFTFKHRGAAASAWLRFQATAAAGAALGMGLVAGGVVLGLHYLLAQGVATLTVLLLGFVVNRRWSFAR